jgi:hypothetical protein
MFARLLRTFAQLTYTNEPRGHSGSVCGCVIEVETTFLIPIAASRGGGDAQGVCALLLVLYCVFFGPNVLVGQIMTR